MVGWGGIVALVAGVFLLSARGGRELAKIDRRAVGFALLTALTICAYSVVDGIGGAARRRSECLFAMAVRRHRRGDVALRAVRATAATSSRRCELFGGAALPAAPCRLLSYGIAIWAMTLAPIAIVATLRETSVLFGAVIAVVVLKEPLRAMRIAAALMIVCGLVLIRLQ